MSKSREIKIATITATVKRRRKHSLLPGWEYGTEISAAPCHDITPKDEAVVNSMADDIRKAL